MKPRRIGIKPFSSNSMWRGGRRFKTKAYTQYQEELHWCVQHWETYDEPIEIEAHFYIKNYKRADVDNFCKPLLDSLQNAGVITNDNLVKRMVIEKHESKTEYIELKIKKI